MRIYTTTFLLSFYYIIIIYSILFYLILLLYACSKYQMEKSFERATATAMVFVSRKCDIALSVPRPTTFYWTRRYVTTEKPHRSIAWRLRPLARISLWQLRGTYRIVRISNHLFNIASPVIGDLVVKRGAFSTHRRAGMRSTRGRQCASPSLFFNAYLDPYLFIYESRMKT